MTDTRATVAAQARAVADAWSPPGAPESWWLTAALLATIADDEVLLDLAAAVPPDRLPALLLSAAVRRLVTELPDEPLARHFPVPGGAQPPRDPGFAAELGAFARAHRDELAALCAEHRYQMNEAGRCADVLPVLARIAAADPRPLALVDLGTGAGLALHSDRYHYAYRGNETWTAGDPASPVQLECEVRSGRPPVALPVLADRVGIDVEPLDLRDPGTRAWLAACVPPEAGAVTRFAAASAIAAARPARTVRGDLLEVLPDVVASLPPGPVCVVDTYVHVFLPPERLARFDTVLAGLSADRDVHWISVDPLVPLGPEAHSTVQGLDVPPEWVEDNRRGGVFGVIGHAAYRDGTRTAEVLGRAHPSAAWLEWLR
ncbi:hypothetical protein GCM10009836_70520 [Pseudonocardia ailaonensis]|uniref:DUF2332 domain-containing protein n=1 Tax=Pseudonocardia ailaonensis TaxID=367279 RepID=A0ABN2NQ20_9PSEU